MPHELALVGIYFSPLLPIVMFGILGALATPWVFMALIVIYVCLLLPFGMVL